MWLRTCGLVAVGFSVEGASVVSTVGLSVVVVVDGCF